MQRIFGSSFDIELDLQVQLASMLDSKDTGVRAVGENLASDTAVTEERAHEFFRYCRMVDSASHRSSSNAIIDGLRLYYRERVRSWNPDYTKRFNRPNFLTDVVKDFPLGRIVDMYSLRAAMLAARSTSNSEIKSFRPRRPANGLGSMSN